MSGAANMPVGETKPKRWRYPKMLPCPRCGSDENLGVYEYEGGWKRVECSTGWNSRNPCNHFTRSHGRIRDAVDDHNRECQKQS